MQRVKDTTITNQSTISVFLDDDVESEKRVSLAKNYDVWVKTASEAIEVLRTGRVYSISLDHDLGDESIVGSGYEVACWIEENAYYGVLPKLKWHCHSANPVGVANMTKALENADRYWDS